MAPSVAVTPKDPAGSRQGGGRSDLNSFQQDLGRPPVARLRDDGAVTARGIISFLPHFPEIPARTEKVLSKLANVNDRAPGRLQESFPARAEVVFFPAVRSQDLLQLVAVC